MTLKYFRLYVQAANPCWSFSLLWIFDSPGGGLCVFLQKFGLYSSFILGLYSPRGEFQEKKNQWNWPFVGGVFEKCRAAAQTFVFFNGTILQLFFTGENYFFRVFAIISHGWKLVFTGVIFLHFSREEDIFYWCFRIFCTDCIKFWQEEKRKFSRED